MAAGRTEVGGGGPWARSFSGAVCHGVQDANGPTNPERFAAFGDPGGCV